MDRAARSRQRVESALTVERNFVSAVLDTVGALVAVFDPAGRIVRFNRACETASGYDFHDPGRPLRLGQADSPARRSLKPSRTSSASAPAASPPPLRTSGCNRDGSLRRIAWSATALLDSQGQVAFIIATGIDVTMQRAAEATLRESEARYRQLVEGSLGMVCTHDLRGMLLSINAHGAETIGRTVEEMVGHSLAEFIVPERKRLLRALPREDRRDRRSAGPASPRPCRRRDPRRRLSQQAHPRRRAAHLTSSASASISPSRSASKAASARSPVSPTPSSSRSATASTASTSKAGSPSSTPPRRRCSATGRARFSAATCTS